LFGLATPTASTPKMDQANSTRSEEVLGSRAVSARLRAVVDLIQDIPTAEGILQRVEAGGQRAEVIRQLVERIEAVNQGVEAALQGVEAALQEAEDALQEAATTQDAAVIQGLEAALERAAAARQDLDALQGYRNTEGAIQRIRIIINDINLRASGSLEHVANYVSEDPEDQQIGIEELVEVLAENSERNCAICLDALEVGQDVVKLPKCQHRYHLQCLATWLRMPERHLCPLCRQIVSYNVRQAITEY